MWLSQVSDGFMLLRELHCAPVNQQLRTQHKIITEESLSLSTADMLSDQSQTTSLHNSCQSFWSNWNSKEPFKAAEKFNKCSWLHITLKYVKINVIYSLIVRFTVNCILLSEIILQLLHEIKYFERMSWLTSGASSTSNFSYKWWLKPCCNPSHWHWRILTK